jgi:hypothetical protein
MSPIQPIQPAILMVLAVLVHAALATSAPYPPPPKVGTPEQQRALAELARSAVTDRNRERRGQKIAALGALARQMLAHRGEDQQPDEIRELIAHFVVETTHVAFVNGDHLDENEFPPPDVTMMDEWVPAELVALGVTQPSDWVAVLYDNGEVAMRLIDAADGFAIRRGGVSGHFEHLSATLNPRHRDRMRATSDYDNLLYVLFAKDRLASGVYLLNLERLADEERKDIERFVALRRRMAELQLRLEDIPLLEPPPKGEPPRPVPYSAEVSRLMRELAEEPEWPVHLFLWSYMHHMKAWRDPIVIERIALHSDPISLRFLARSGMIDPALVPEPAKDPHKTPSGARVIPSSRATSRPAAAGPD